MIVNADDFGVNNRVNNAILQCFENGMCSSTTIMANMTAFEEACQIVHDNKLLYNVGIHFVLTSGRPLYKKMQESNKFCDQNGYFKKRKKRLFRLTKSEREMVASELRLQVEKCRKYGLVITHADTHHHIHEEWAVLPMIINVCKEYGIPYLRLARNCSSESVPVLNRLYRHLINYRIHKACLAGTRYFGSLTDYLGIVNTRGADSIPGNIEVMVHPVYDNNVIIDAGTELHLENVKYYNKLRSYSDQSMC